jgi:hypothetical protein
MRLAVESTPPIIVSDIDDRAAAMLSCACARGLISLNSPPTLSEQLLLLSYRMSYRMYVPAVLLCHRGRCLQLLRELAAVLVPGGQALVAV